MADALSYALSTSKDSLLFHVVHQPLLGLMSSPAAIAALTAESVQIKDIIQSDAYSLYAKKYRNIGKALNLSHYRHTWYLTLK